MVQSMMHTPQPLAVFVEVGVVATATVRFFADFDFVGFDIEILIRFRRHACRHHRSPISANKPAGQDLGAPLAPGIADSTAPIAAEGQSFLDNVVAQFWPN